ncbi:hypothetical protein DICSQDRAFT_140621 [Dichomitus squalens LYAD-421 SS1]|uniref:Uncharacterized protein n=1 Tax=Dichomitus squalens (strain LYAD-421) TaxID=732165 RepID=R7SMT0_DICSQ|nr:uncharacterized protein DICSQDRAFT_140621 [Dichomitus squalens LYAD-421 SS1]EJF57173.1 hypothetical protein DICSQDRAFT_140621 [Dichomitus squalens LYAD-421 SS1]
MATLFYTYPYHNFRRIAGASAADYDASACGHVEDLVRLNRAAYCRNHGKPYVYGNKRGLPSMRGTPGCLQPYPMI